MLVKTPSLDRFLEMPPEAQTEHPETEGPVTHFFCGTLFTSLKDDLHMVKRELSQDLKVVQKNLAEIGDRVATLEDNASGRDEELENLQQEVIRLKEQQMDLKVYTEDLENRLWCNNICIRDTPMEPEGEDINSYVKALFAQILGPSAPEVQVHRAHRRSLQHWR
ncbi:hypothetical protein NDU88_005648 [Pleurodeles waltl]|uniref:Uncharacterized protein n=1 Tax=Pleurodeles waltl TaxID=8319 RepID=A0AAV7TUV6_PLEWA|nr:hypothetical protein NDU88_005648 [Pleurodeles waltl]